MGLPGSGKTTLANELGPMLNAKRLNADEVRKEANDWDFSAEGRKRQAKRMADFAIRLKEKGNYVVADFICPTCLLYTSPSPRDRQKSRMPSSA